MTKKISLLVLLVATIVFLHTDVFSSIFKENEAANFESCILSIYSPNNCFYKLTFKKSGQGSLNEFMRSDPSDSLENDSLISHLTFKIWGTSDMMKLSKIVEQVKGSGIIKPHKRFDTFNFELTIDEKVYINMSGQNETINNLLNVLFKYVKNAKDKCDFFKMYKQTI